jgi:hypothetical protein
MIGIDLRPELESMIQAISQRNTYSGNKVSDSIIKMFEVEITELHDGVLVPYWLSVLEHGRGPRKSTKDSELWKRIYKWMEKHNKFKSTKPDVRIREAKSVTWYINKYGNQQFRNKAFVDIYTSERKKCIENIDKKFSQHISKITMDVI